jgi:hypothetical protein
MCGFGGSALGLAAVAGIVVVDGGGGAVVVAGVVVAGAVPWVAVDGCVAGVVCDPAFAGPPLELPQPAADAAIRSRGRSARPISAA